MLREGMLSDKCLPCAVSTFCTLENGVLAMLYAGWNLHKAFGTDLEGVFVYIRGPTPASSLQAIQLCFVLGLRLFAVVCSVSECSVEPAWARSESWEFAQRFPRRFLGWRPTPLGHFVS